MEISPILFYLLATLIVGFSVATVATKNPIYSALCLAMTMVTLAFMFFQLGAYFIGGVQLIVYAGAVMVLFVMVLMLFDLQHELEAFSERFFPKLLKLMAVCVILGTLGGVVFSSTEMITTRPGVVEQATKAVTTQDMAKALFSQYLLAFEILGLLLLLVAIGVVAMSRIKGGTHAKP